MKKSTQNDWEKQFSKKFTDNVLRGGYGNDLIVKEAEPIMNFIRQLLADARREVIDEVKMRLETYVWDSNLGDKDPLIENMENRKLLNKFVLATLRKETN